ncbi:hypothetical protein HMPREF9296_0186 [Prevotella disiens FB035-09AN]|uniref:BppU N-terminal domain-containing protein n=1 Tax=Prevotella disiens FB035-09AN TaxID=866771 RepID=E1KU24_9BACT|nr:hypothetical protein [Prevotella disiens]EFL45014.1 hypothetical protein HMPREF9296_0186 [Prevotella disiens FB035-09AN]
MAKVIARAYISITNVNDGEKGDTGDTALTLIVTPNTFTFQTNDEGDIENLAQNKGKIRMFLGQTEVVPSSISITPTNCYARIAGDNTLYIDGVSPNQWSGNVKITAKYKGQTRTATAEFMVSAQKWNEAKFLANDTQFKSIIAQNEADKQGLESRMSTIEQDAGKIRLEVKKQTFGGVNLLKGASLRSDEVSLIKGKSHKICIHETINIRRDNQGHNMHPYLEINVSGRTQDLYSSGRFWTWLEAGKTYVFSMYYKVFGYATSTLSIAVARSNEYTGDATNWLNGEGEDTIIKDYNWHRYTRRYAINTTGYYFFAPALQRNGRVFISEVQLEEGTKPTGWHDPDVVESIQKAGIDIDLQRIIVTTNNFYIKNSEGQVTTAVDKDGNLIAGAIQTKDIGNGHIIMRNNTQEFYKPGATYPSRIIGYIGDDWVDRRLDKDGSVIWELSENGIVYFRRPARWEQLYERYLDTVPNLGAFFNKNTWRAIDLIFGEKSGTPASLYGWYAARDARGVITSSRGVTYEEAVQNNGKVFDVSGRFTLFNFLRPFTGIVRSATVNFYHQLKSVDGSFVPPEYTNVRNKFSLGEFYNVQFTGNNNVWYTYVTVYENGSLIDSYKIFKN